MTQLDYEAITEMRSETAAFHLSEHLYRMHDRSIISIYLGDQFHINAWQKSTPIIWGLEVELNNKTTSTEM